MTESIILINETDDECRIAIVENNVLQEMLIEHTASGQIKNNIYKAVVVQVQTSLQAAFVDFGDKKHGFLPNSELNPSLISEKKFRKHEPIQRKLKVGQELIVQVTREATDHKGSALTTNITLPGRFMVLMPNSDKGGISKKIDDADERERLKGFLSGIEFEEHAVIIRTAGVGRGLAELKKDYTTLKKTWNDVRSSFEKIKKPGLILEEADVVTRTLRDYYTEDIKEIWVDNPETFQKSLAFFKQVAPRRQKDLKLFVGDRSLYASYNIERQVEQLTSNDVKLKSGGSIVIDQTEALVAIDVNSGRSNQEGNIDSTALRTNMEAAEEIARQLRLRNLGGLVVIDFIDMENESYRTQVENNISDAMKKDKAQVRFNPISQFGLLELSRQRLAVGISSTVESTCPFCNGKGKISSLLASTNQIIRSIRELAAKGNVTGIEGELPLELVNHVLNERRQSITDLELEFGVDIILRGNPDLAVFSEKFLTPVFAFKKQPENQPKNESTKPDQNKKRGKKQPVQKDGEQKKQPKRQDKNKDSQQPIVDAAADEDRDQKSKSNDVVDAAADEDRGQKSKSNDVVEKTVKREKSTRKPKAKTKAKPMETSDTDNPAGFGIHPSCLFTDVKELEEEELEEITVAFGNRLKGKSEDGGRQIIEEKYLWKNMNGNSNKASVEEEKSDKPAIEEKETKTAKPRKSSAAKRGRKKQSGNKAESEGESKTSSTKKSPQRKSTPRKSAPKKVQEKESVQSKPASKKVKTTRKAKENLENKPEGKGQKPAEKKPKKTAARPASKKVTKKKAGDETKSTGSSASKTSSKKSSGGKAKNVKSGDSAQKKTQKAPQRGRGTSAKTAKPKKADPKSSSDKKK
jgi:ribonuclease E